MEAWTIKQLYEEMQNDLLKCHTRLERDLCTIINKRDIKEAAIKFSSERKLTPGEKAILEVLGINI